MAHWNSRGLRGSSFEEIINFTNERYRQSGLALFQKIPTPITPVRMDEETRTITLAYFEKRLQLIISAWRRGFPLPLMPRKRQEKACPCRISMHIRWLLWRNFAASGDFPFFSYIFLRQTHIIFCRLKH